MVWCPIRNWKVAAPLKADRCVWWYIDPQDNPQLKSCGSIEGYVKSRVERLIFGNPQLKSCGSIEGSYRFEFPTAAKLQQSATEKLRLHWRIGYIYQTSRPFLSIRNWKVAAPLKVYIPLQRVRIFIAIRNWKVAAPLKGDKIQARGYSLFHQSATEKLRLHWRTLCLIFTLQPKSNNPQLKSCGSIEGFCNDKVQARTLFSNPQLKSCGSIEGKTHKILWWWNTISIRNWKVAAPLKEKYAALAKALAITIRNWKVAAPLKVGIRVDVGVCDCCNPQLKSCGSIEGVRTNLPRSRLDCNPQLKSCGSIEGVLVEEPGGVDVINPQLKSCGSIEGNWNFRYYTKLISIRNWKVAAPLKGTWQCFWCISPFHSIRNWKVAAPLKEWINGTLIVPFSRQSATEKLRLHWRKDMCC